MSNYAIVISYQFDNEERASIVLDTINDTNINGYVTITEQPVVSGDVISDHMFRNPKAMSFSGSISLNGSKTTVITGKGSKLANFEELFERLQNEAVRCDIVKISLQNEKDIRFLHRQNMVLQSFTWRERINSIDYTLQWKEVLTTKVVIYDVDIDDAYLPNVTEPETASFTTTLMDTDQAMTEIYKLLQDEGLVTEAFSTLLSQTSEQGFILLGVGLMVAAILIAVCSAPILGLIVAIIGFVVCIVNAIKYGIQRRKIEDKWHMRIFDATNNDSKNDAEIKRFASFMEQMNTELEALNEALHVYTLSDNIAQECMLSIGDDYYIFTFTKNNVDNSWSLKITDINDALCGSMTNISTSPTDFSQLTNANALATASNNSKMYLIYLPTQENEDNSIADDPNDLRNYFILVSDINVEEYNKLLTDVISNALIETTESYGD